MRGVGFEDIPPDEANTELSEGGMPDEVKNQRRFGAPLLIVIFAVAALSRVPAHTDSGVQARDTADSGLPT
jgi:hypothetical protein